MKLNKFIILLLTVIVIAAGSTYLFYRFYAVYDITEYDMYLTVGEYVGFNLDTDAVYFGTTSPGGSSSRNLMLKNEYTKPLKVMIRWNGDFAKWISLKEKYFILEPNETKKITVNAHIPMDASLGNYTGKLRVIFRRI